MKSEDCILALCGNLRQLRTMHGLSEKEMARIIGISVKSLALLENNRIPPRLGCDFLFRASRHFKIKASELFLPMEK